MITPNFLSTFSSTLIVAPSGQVEVNMGHSAHSCVATLEKAIIDKIRAITCELRLPALVDQNWQMTSSHSQRLKVAVH